MPGRNKRSKSPRTDALYRNHVEVMRGHRTVRVAAYPPRNEQETGVTLGIGYADPDSFSRITVELTPDNWKEIQNEVKKAFAAAENQTKVKAAASVGVKPSEPTEVPLPTGTRKRKVAG